MTGAEREKYIWSRLTAAGLTPAGAAGLMGPRAAAAVVPFFLLYALAGGAVILGVLCAMAQRLREIDGGEEDEAKKY